ncbi:TetR family transcriptional regulator [Gordonibacter sp. An230]|uniref:TetR/AcrR family transcriptional regulator n=1 Tax=Gordonibacter sp. An230 TaxID=1965592 RepID=UPI000B39B3F2|nr:TetR/AcrR family transcriptional regulator [Gordonibacter sp. An230]OUO90210.1 TetR family transcriptional regulator [Gordonibacter sp. An230]
MGNKPVISKQQILDAAFALASESGLAGLSIRDVARACNVAVGTVYNSYPTKNDLVNDVVGRFWNEALADRMPHAVAGDDFVCFCQELARQLSEALAKFRDDWLVEIAALDAQGLATARKREEACFAHIRRGLEMALERDPRVLRDRLRGALAPEPLCAFVWDSMLLSIKHGDPSCRTLFALIRSTAYEI